MDFLGAEPINITESYSALVHIERKINIRMKWIQIIKLLLNKQMKIVSRAVNKKSTQYREKCIKIKIISQKHAFKLWQNKTKWKQLYHKITIKTKHACFVKISELLQSQRLKHNEKIKEKQLKITKEKQNNIRKVAVYQEILEKKTLEKFHKRWNRQKGRVMFSIREKWQSLTARYTRIQTRNTIKQQKDVLVKRNFWINSAFSILHENYIKSIEQEAIHYHTFLIWYSFAQRLKTRNLIKAKHSKSPGMSTWLSFIQRYIRISTRKALFSAEKRLRIQNTWIDMTDRYFEMIKGSMMKSERRRIALEKDRKKEMSICDQWLSKWIFEYKIRTLSDGLLKSTFEDTLSIYKTSTQNNAAYIIQSRFRAWNERRKKRERFFTLLDTMSKWKSSLLFKRHIKIKPPKVIAEYEMPRVKLRLRLPMLAKHATNINSVKALPKTLNAMIAAKNHRAVNESVSKVIIAAASTPRKVNKSPPSASSGEKSLPVLVEMDEITSEPEKAQIERRCSEANLSKLSHNIMNKEVSSSVETSLIEKESTTEIHNRFDEEEEEEEDNIDEIVLGILDKIEFDSFYNSVPLPTISINCPPIKKEDVKEKERKIENKNSNSESSAYQSSSAETGHSSEIAARVVDSFALEDIIPAIVAPSINVSISPISSPKKDDFADEIVSAIKFDSIFESFAKINLSPLLTFNRIEEAKEEDRSSESGDPFTKSQEIHEIPSGMETSMPNDSSSEEEEISPNIPTHNAEENEKSFPLKGANVSSEEENEKGEKSLSESISFDDADGWAEEVNKEEEQNSKEDEKDKKIAEAKDQNNIEEKESSVNFEDANNLDEKSEELQEKDEDIVCDDYVIKGSDFTFLNKIVDVGNYLPITSITPITTLNRKSSISTEANMMEAETETESDKDFGMSDVLDEIEIPLDIAAVIEPVYNFEQSNSNIIEDEESKIDLSFSSSDLDNELKYYYDPMIQFHLNNFESSRGEIRIDPEVVDEIIKGIDLFSDVPGILNKIAPQFDHLIN